MRNANNNMRIINPNTRVVWIAALCSELKVTNPDNIKENIIGYD